MLELNLTNRAAAQTTKDFNSACMFDGVPLGATASGLYRIGGYTDHGTAIPALIRSGMLDLGTERIKRFRFFYFGLQASGALKLTVLCDGTDAASYTVNGGNGGAREVRVPISRTYQGRYWQWQVENVSGSFFALYSVKALPVVL